MADTDENKGEIKNENDLKALWAKIAKQKSKKEADAEIERQKKILLKKKVLSASMKKIDSVKKKDELIGDIKKTKEGEDFVKKESLLNAKGGKSASSKTKDENKKKKKKLVKREKTAEEDLKKMKGPEKEKKDEGAKKIKNLEEKKNAKDTKKAKIEKKEKVDEKKVASVSEKNIFEEKKDEGAKKLEKPEEKKNIKDAKKPKIEKKEKVDEKKVASVSEKTVVEDKKEKPAKTNKKPEEEKRLDVKNANKSFDKKEKLDTKKVEDSADKSIVADKKLDTKEGEKTSDLGEHLGFVGEKKGFNEDKKTKTAFANNFNDFSFEKKSDLDQVNKKNLEIDKEDRERRKREFLERAKRNLELAKKRRMEKEKENKELLENQKMMASKDRERPKNEKNLSRLDSNLLDKEAGGLKPDNRRPGLEEKPELNAKEDLVKVSKPLTTNKIDNEVEVLETKPRERTKEEEKILDSLEDKIEDLDADEEFVETFWDVLEQANISKRMFFTLIIVLVSIFSFLIFLLFGGYKLFLGDDGDNVTEVVVEEEENNDIDFSFGAGDYPNFVDISYEFGNLGSLDDGFSLIVDDSAFEAAYIFGDEYNELRVDLIVYLDVVRRSQEIYLLDIYDYVDRNSARRESINEYLDLALEEIENMETAIYQINRILLSYEGIYESVEDKALLDEEEFFNSLDSLKGQAAYESLLSFVESNNEKYELKAYYNAYSTVLEMLENTLDLLKPKYDDVLVNKEAIIKGIRVYDVPDSDIDSIIPLDKVE